MKRCVLMRIALFIFLSFLSPKGSFSAEREFTFIEKVNLNNLGEGEKDVKVWLPYPVSDEWQSIEDFKINAPIEGKIVKENKYGNNIFYLYMPSYKETSLGIEVNFKIKRNEYDFSKKASAEGKDSKLFLLPDRLVQVDKEMKVLAKSIVKGKKDRIEQARNIYDYIIDEFTYTKDDPRVCKIGNSRLSLEFKKGQCSEYHSTFISLARALKIPAKFELGFTVPGDKKEGEIGGYHCWAKFYVEGKGWFPVDVSNADKYPEKKEYYFSRIDENRIHFTTGRDIKLPEAEDKASMPLNYFIYPYAEVNGKEFKDIEKKFSYKE